MDCSYTDIRCDQVSCDLCEKIQKQAYNKALDDFADLISKHSHIDFDECYVDGGGTVITTKEVFDLAEQLKK